MSVRVGCLISSTNMYIGRKIEQVILNIRMRVELVPPNRILDRLLEKSQYEMVHKVLVSRGMDYWRKLVRTKGVRQYQGCLASYIRRGEQMHYQ